MKTSRINLLTAILLILQGVSFLFFPFDILPNMLYNHYITAVVAFIDGVPRPLGLALLGFELLTLVLFLGSAIAVLLKKKIFVRSAIFLNLLNVIFCLWEFIGYEPRIWLICKILFSGFMIFLLLYYFKEHFGLNQLFKRRKATTEQNEELPHHS